MQNNLPDDFPKTSSDWQRVIACAPGHNQATANIKNAVVVREGGIAAVRQALAERKQSEQWVTLRLNQEILARWRASGAGWESRIAQVLAEHAP